MFHEPPARAETVFTYSAPALKFGPGASAEIGADLRALGANRTLLVTDAGVAASGASGRVADGLSAAGLDAVVFDEVHIEPTDQSLTAAIDFARAAGPFDAIVAVGGGSSIDTAKAVNLMLTNRGELMDYVNAPVGAGKVPEHPLLPLVAVPTTTGTGSESTTICVLDVTELSVKTGISHERLRPRLAVVDPDLTFSQPPSVTAASGLDVLCHALESWTARPWTSYEAKTPQQRVPYCGSNPIADMWSLKALEIMSTSFRRAVQDGSDANARADMAMAATFAGLGFGNAGVHIPHANAYPIAGQAREFRPDGYPVEEGEALVPHGMAVALTAPAAFRFTFDADPGRHVQAARILAGDAELPADPREQLPAALTAIMRDVGLPAGLGEIGFTSDDIGDLAEGAMKQQRLLATAPRPVTRDNIIEILHDSMELW